MKRFSKEDPSPVDEIVAAGDALCSQFDFDADSSEDAEEYISHQYRVKNGKDRKKVPKFKKHIFRSDED